MKLLLMHRSRSAAAIIARPWIGIRSSASRDPIHELARALTNCEGMPQILTVIERSFTSSLGFPPAIFVAQGDRLRVRHHSSEFVPGQDDFARATLSMSSGRLTAHATSDACEYFLPLMTWKGTIGALGFQVSGTRRISRPAWALLRSFADQTALGYIARHT